MAMKQLMLEAGTPTINEVPLPSCAPGMVLVRTHYSFVSSGTESATIAATEGSLATKFLRNVSGNITKIGTSIKENGVAGTLALISGKRYQLLEMGYSCSGQVIAIGAAVKEFAVGDYVACGGAGFASHAEIVAVPKHLVARLSSNKYLKEASITTIGAIALQGVRRSAPQLGESVVVIGLGLIGLITVQLLKQSGCFVIGIDVAPDRLALAKEHGCNVVYAADDEV